MKIKLWCDVPPYIHGPDSYLWASTRMHCGEIPHGYTRVAIEVDLPCKTEDVTVQGAVVE